MNLWPVFFREMLIFSNRIRKPGYIAASVMTPLLYLITFGMGIGRRFSVEGASYLVFIIPGICAMSAMNNSFSGIATSLAVGRLHFRSVENILVSPLSTLDIALGEICGGAVRGLFSSMFIILIAPLMGASFPRDPLFYVAWLLTTVTFAALGTFAGFMARSHEDTSTYSNFIIVPMSFFCGTFFPIDNLPGAINLFLRALPLTHSVICMRSGYRGEPIDPLNLAALLFFCVASTALAVQAIRRSDR